MSKWVSSKISSLVKISSYQKPKRYINVIRMDTNENLALSNRFIAGLMKEASKKTDLREYPSYQYDQLRMELGKYLNLSKNFIAIGNGSDQIIDLILSTFANNSSTITINPTFTFYKDRCNLHSIKINEFILDSDFSFNVKKFIAMSKGARICYICSPNNPTGNQFNKKLMTELINSFNGLIIVDEAYVEFAEYSLKNLVRTHDNLIILRTMSKAFGLAGARVGYMISNNKIIELFINTIQYPYPLSVQSLKTASVVLSKLKYIKLVIRNIRKERKRVFDKINSFDELKAFKSDANFVLFEAGKKYQSLYRKLIKKGIVIRNIGDIGKHKGCLRVTIGTPKMNNKFLNELKVVFK